MFVRACPGGGKTRTVVERFLRRTAEVASRRGIAVLSFSRRATKEIRERCREGGKDHLLAFPNYVGTLDGFFFRFVFRPVEQASSQRRVQVLESWDEIGAKVSVGGVRCAPVSLDAFPMSGGRASFCPDRLHGSEVAIAKEIEKNKAKWEANAARYIRSLTGKGIHNCEAVRTRVHELLGAGALTHVILPAIAARFEEVIVDEAQDCDEPQIRLLEALATAGARLVVVADPEQAIYEFRAARPDLLQGLTAGMPIKELSGNWRSTPAICGLANSMRDSALTPMRPVGPLKNDATPVYVIPYKGSSADEAPGLLRAAARADGVKIDELRLLSHQKSVALKTAGIEEVDGSGGGTAAMVVRLAGRMARGQLNGADAESGIRQIERLVLRWLAIDEDDATIAGICETHRVDTRWLRGAAFAVLRTASESVAGKAGVSLGEATEMLRGALEVLQPPPDREWKKSVKVLVPLRDATQAITLQKTDTNGYRTTLANTIHAVKGSECAAALVVFSARRTTLDVLLQAWEQRSELEAKRVAYVAMTRAERVLGIAVPESGAERVVRILTAAEVKFRLVGPAAKDEKGSRGGNGGRSAKTRKKAAGGTVPIAGAEG